MSAVGFINAVRALEFFREHLSITVSPSTIHDFVRVRRGRAKRNVGSAQDEGPADPKALHRPKVTENPLAADEAVRQRIAALKRRTPAEEPRPLFKYEEDEPLKFSATGCSDSPLPIPYTGGPEFPEQVAGR